jgi:hypothetical protein
VAGLSAPPLASVMVTVPANDLIRHWKMSEGSRSQLASMLLKVIKLAIWKD